MNLTRRYTITYSSNLYQFKCKHNNKWMKIINKKIYVVNKHIHNVIVYSITHINISNYKKKIKHDKNSLHKELCKQSHILSTLQYLIIWHQFIHLIPRTHYICNSYEYTYVEAILRTRQFMDSSGLIIHA